MEEEFVDQLTTTLAVLLVLHREDEDGWCEECRGGQRWPCRTAKVLVDLFRLTG